ncbi:hypothetical protein LguiA_025295 [Lonicera macranthoides]
MKIHTVSVFCNIIFLTLFHSKFSVAADSLSSSQSISGNTTLVSARGKFQLGFFSPTNSNNQYLGIWFNNIPNRTVVWVANRDNPFNESTGILRLGDDGNLILVDQTNRTAWSSNATQNLPVNNVVAQLLDTGNLVLRDERSGNDESFIWQSFDYPSDTLLAGMKIGWDIEIGLNRYLTSWENADNPSRGSFTYSLDIGVLPQFVLRRGPDKQFRSGMWNGVQFSGILLLPNLVYVPMVITNSRETYYEYGLYNDSIVTMFRLSDSGVMQRLVWNNSSLEWLVSVTLPRDRCDNYNQCGPNAVCNIGDLRSCSCLTGYVPRSPRDWDIFIRSGGCIRRDPLNCSTGEGFIELEDMKMPDLLRFWMSNTSMTMDECRRECLRNCSCTAYTNPNATAENSGCLLWFEDLTDLRILQQNGSEKLYLRVTASDLQTRSNSNNKSKVLVAVTVSVAIGVLLFVASCIIWKRRLIFGMCLKGTNSDIPAKDFQEKDDENIDLSIFSRATIEEATDYFSFSNKIGEGGFGPVYKGLLTSGPEIAVKRLSQTSGQGVNEFKNEVTLIAKLQHRNLVRLLGCCIQGEERMLVYEYMPNGSLDSFIFGGIDRSRNNFLVWRRRFDIIVGIARGLLYLHRDSRLRIIHRDLKASNVLLDSDMNPKISDFGTARAFGGDQSLAKTMRVIGTYGYMSPEYAIDGIFSTKSDVFSFGVLVLEIVSGKRNRQFHHPAHDLNLLGHAWKLWTEGKAFELMDPVMVDSLSVSEVVKCVQVGLLCVQQRAEDRPEMSSVLLMLDSVSVMLPQPTQPGFFTGRSCETTEYGGTLATNEATNTLVEGR